SWALGAMGADWQLQSWAGRMLVENPSCRSSKFKEPQPSGDGAGDGCARVKKVLGWCSRDRARRQQTLSSLAEKTARDRCCRKSQFSSDCLGLEGDRDRGKPWWRQRSDRPVVSGNRRAWERDG